MRILLAPLLLAAVCGSATFAETNEQRGKRVVDEALAALGGQAFLTVRDRTESGRAYSFYQERLSGLSLAHIYTRYLDQPDSDEPSALRVREREAFGKKQDDIILFTQGAGYELTFRGARPLADLRVAQFKLSTMRNVFYILRERLGEKGLLFESHGSDFFENRPVEIVDIVDGNNDTVTVYFDQLTKFPTRQSFFAGTPSTTPSSRKSPSSPSFAMWAAAPCGRSVSGASAMAKRSSRCTRTAWKSTGI